MKDIFKDLTVIIPVRLGSSRIKEKILLPFYKDLNLLEWKINQVKSISESIKILVSSNSELVKEIAKKNNVSYHDRGDYLSVGHQASFSEVITGIVKDIETNHFAWVTVVVPLMQPKEYIEAFNLYFDEVVKNRLNDSLVSVNLLKEYFWDDQKPLNYRADKFHTISQDLPNIYRVTNGLYMCNKEYTLEKGYFLGKKPYKHIVSKISGIDIDEFEDYEMSRALIPIYFNRTKND
jgi:CMP-N-acetylneuraminic acid synthetase